ncbi:bifunctional 2',3'-cyclic-nucleotide 2'-phosphodiesterase/3'-nucleotidase [Cytobacillus gottheilii]|uniref:Bifunctional 2',3'-cyclic-nucleotide 2'-phosphodiesterase/3'-nucleotidase n=1 Tax=Cytobacillus gottheilii TaxID=859144 RepID=A0ABX8FB31_9BACI|nr:bifunctional 2',3'-cyclic-nucleotide 2'-phosphodiesterase/3'-nucleotidase [Cytobacillus gottheilii]QVY61305.1 bifunctional 2',3'-cyclic-nucleotide 2'-phosphodiesterase/3'-nucleotidase [Cytobacillus gottheilii]
MKPFVLKSLVSATVAAGFFLPAFASTPEVQAAEEATIDLRILETSDIHMNLLNYDYFVDQPSESLGLSKTAALIKQAREEEPNSILLDNGDLLQGNPFGDYYATGKELQPGEVHPAIKVLNELDYDAMTLGNHEFNYGLDFLNEAINDADFDVLSANIYKHDQQDENYFTPYTIMDKTVKDSNGQDQTIQVGVIGFVAPKIMSWDKAHLEGKVIANDIVKEAEKFVPQMKEEGADVVVVLSHAGLGEFENGAPAEYQEFAENASYHLTNVEGIDAVLTGHEHGKFPAADPASADYPDGHGIDNAKGTINGVPVTMPGSFGDHLGVIDLELKQENNDWVVQEEASTATLKSIEGVQNDDSVNELLKTEHETTLNYIREAVGTTTAPINSYFSLVQDDPSVQIVSNAQKWYVENWVEKNPEFKDIPVLSAAAPFKAGGRNGVEYFTDLPEGEIAIKNVADLYLYPNTLYAVKINGSELKEWLEWSAGQFNQIDPNKSEVQSLVNADFRSYNFDVIDGVTYEIDVTEPAKYDNGQKVLNEGANRIKNLEFNGEDVTADMEFIVATNNYRASTNSIMNADSKNTILASPDENRQIIINYITETKTINPAADGNWTFAPIAKDTKVSFESSPKARDYIASGSPISYVETQDSGFALFETVLSSEGYGEGNEGSKTFTDVPAGFWAYDYITELAEKGVINGTTETTFSPSANVTRGQFTAFIARAFDLESTKKAPFTDSKGSLENEIAAAYEAGIINGTSSTKFEPNKEITRDQMAAIAVRAYEYKTGKKAPTAELKFKDNTKISASLYTEVQKAAALGIMNGTSAGTFEPLKTAKRDQAAKVVSELLGNL